MARTLALEGRRAPPRPGQPFLSAPRASHPPGGVPPLHRKYVPVRPLQVRPRMCSLPSATPRVGVWSGLRRQPRPPPHIAATTSHLGTWVWAPAGLLIISGAHWVAWLWPHAIVLCSRTPLCCCCMPFNMLLLYSCSTARAASRRQLQTTVVYGFVAYRMRPAGRTRMCAQAWHTCMKLEASWSRSGAGAVRPAQIRVYVYVRPAVAACAGTSSGRPGPACAAIFDHRPGTWPAGYGAGSVFYTPHWDTVPVPTGPNVAHSTSVRAIRDGAACPHLGGPSDRGAGLLGHCRRGVGKPEARGPRLSPVRLRIDLWSAPYRACLCGMGPLDSSLPPQLYTRTCTYSQAQGPIATCRGSGSSRPRHAWGNSGETHNSSVSPLPCCRGWPHGATASGTIPTGSSHGTSRQGSSRGSALDSTMPHLFGRRAGTCPLWPNTWRWSIATSPRNLPAVAFSAPSREGPSWACT